MARKPPMLGRRLARCSSFVIIGDTYIEFVRLAYDVEATVAKVEAIPELDNFLGTRLLDGR